MKKWMIILCAAVILLAFCACQSEQAKAVDAQISAIGAVNLDSEPLISDAERALAALPEKEQRQVKQAQELTQARNAYDALVQQQKAEEIDEAIEAIGTVTEKSAAAIEKARKRYDAVSSDVQAYVQNVQALEEAETVFDGIQAARMDEQIAEIGEVTAQSGDQISAARASLDALNETAKQLVQQENVLKAAEDTYRTICAEEAAAKIDAIGDVTLNRIYAIRQARKAYDALPEDIDACVRNAGVLTAAEDTLRVLQANSKESLMQKAKAYTDSFRDFTLYYASTTPFDDNSHEWIYGVRTLVLPYVGKTQTDVSLLALCHYTGKDWIFFKSISFKVDGESCGSWTVQYNDVDRNTFYGGVAEAAGYTMRDSDIDLFLKIAASEQTVIRFEGDHKLYDLTVSAEDKQAIVDIINLYYAMQQ